MRPVPYCLLWIGAGALVFLGSFLEYQGPTYYEAGGFVGQGGLLGGLAVLSLGERFLRANGMRPLVLV